MDILESYILFAHNKAMELVCVFFLKWFHFSSISLNTFVHFNRRELLIYTFKQFAQGFHVFAHELRDAYIWRWFNGFNRFCNFSFTRFHFRLNRTPFTIYAKWVSDPTFIFHSFNMPPYIWGCVIWSDLAIQHHPTQSASKLWLCEFTCLRSVDGDQKKKDIQTNCENDIAIMNVKKWNENTLDAANAAKWINRIFFHTFFCPTLRLRIDLFHATSKIYNDHWTETMANAMKMKSTI